MKRLLAVSVLAFMAAFTSVSAQTRNDQCVSYLKSHYQTPSEYIVSKFEKYDVVFLGEDHRIKDNLLMVQGLIPELYKNGVYNIGMEFGSSEMQAKMDSLVCAPEYDVQLAREMMFYYNTGWAYVEYMDVARAAWEFNRTLPEGKPKFRVLNLSYRFNWPGYSGQYPESMKRLYNQGHFELFRADVVEKEVVEKGEKVLILTGALHSYTKYQVSVCDALSEGFVRFDWGTFGNIVYERHPEKTFTILLHHPLSNYPGKMPWVVSPADGNIQKIMAKCGNKPCGFDLEGTPLGDLRDHSRVSIGRPDFKMSDFYDGYVFMKPFNKLSGCTVDTLFLTPENFGEAVKYFPDPDWHAKPETIAEYMKQITDYADLQSQYSKIR